MVVVVQLELIWRRGEKVLKDNVQCQKGTETGIRTDSEGDTCQRSLQTIDKQVWGGGVGYEIVVQSFQTSDIGPG